MIANYDQLVRNIEHGVYDFTENGKCTSCGSCCSNLLWLSEKEIMRIKRYVKKHRVKEQVHKAPAVLAEPAIDLTCPFLNEEKDHDKCMIYPVRPALCACFLCSDQKGTKTRMANERAVRRLISMKETFFGEK